MDELLKRLFGDDDRIKYIAKVNSYDFTYKPEAQEVLGIDGDEHSGIIVQDIKDNPVFKGCTGTNPVTGTGTLKIPELAAASVANEGELARKVIELEARLEKMEKLLGDR